MSLVYRVTKIGSRLKYKLKHHRGHGIHSPFVFDFINNVIEEKYPYYVYDDVANYLDSLRTIDADTKKHRLIFRTINRFNPTDVLVLGEGMSEFLRLYIQSVSKKIKIFDVDQNINTGKKWDCIYLNIRRKENVNDLLVENVFDKINTQSFIIVDNIRTNRSTQAFWRKLVKDQRVRISLDLYHLGILFFDTKYYKKNYKLSF